MHSVTSSPVSSRCTPPRFWPAARWISKAWSISDLVGARQIQPLGAVRAPDAFRDVLPGELEVHAAEVLASRAMDLEGLVNLRSRRRASDPAPWGRPCPRCIP